MPHAAATEMVPCPPAASASRKRFGVMRLPLLNRLTMTAATIAIAAAVCIVFVFDETR